MGNIIELIKPVITPIVVLIIALIFRKPIWSILSNISKMTDRQSLKLGDFEWTVYGLDQVVLEREMLRCAIIMAAADDAFREKEMNHLSNMAYGLNSHLEKLDDKMKIAVLKEAILMAVSDGVFSMAEYRVVLTKCKELNISEEQLYPKIKEVKISERCEFEDELKEYLSQKVDF